MGDNAVIRQRTVHVDDETWNALSDYARRTGDNASAVLRDALRAYLSAAGYVFTAEPRRYNRRGQGRTPAT